MQEVFCDNFIHMAQTSDLSKLLNLSGKFMHGIYSVFTLTKVSGHNGKEPISKKKLESGKVQLAARKEVLGWIVDGATRCIKLAREK